MKFSGQGPNIHNVLAGLVDDDGKTYEIYNDQAAEWPYPADSDVVEPKAGQSCHSCGAKFVTDELVYLTIETSQWVCWRHLQGLTEPVRMEPEK